MTKKILFYSVNGLGLGHVTRLLAIARQIKKLNEKIEILFINSNESNVIFKEGFVNIKIGSKLVRQNFKDKKLFDRIMQTTVINTVNSFNPDTLVVDTFPIGYMNELLPILNWKMKKYFIFREQKSQQINEFFLNVIKLYDTILIPHLKEHNNFFSVLENSKINHKFIGNIMIRDSNDTNGDNLTKNTKDKINVFINFGGGGDSNIDFFHEQILNETKGFNNNYHFYLFVGPLCTFGDKYNHYNNITILRDIYPLAQYLNNFQIAISAAGYNMTHELLHFKIPTIFIPLNRVKDDQQERVNFYQNLGLCYKAESPTEIFLKDMLNKISHDNELKNNLNNYNIENGALNAAKTILEID